MHTLIVGVTMSGKSTLARAIACEVQNRGYGVIVHDPLLSEWGERALVLDNEADFMQAVVSACHDEGQYLVIVDEADTVLGMGQKRNWWLMLRGRHYGLKVLILTQRPALVAPSCRGMCSEAYVFSSCKKDAELLAGDYNAPGLLGAPKLEQGQYLHARWVDGKKVVDRGKVF